MKKLLLTVALVLAVVTSLVAGTMAAYTQQLDTTSQAISAKTFSIKDTTSDSFQQAFKLAPGESVEYSVVVTNDGEVNSTLDMSAAIVAADGNDIDGLTLDIVSVEKLAVDEASAKNAKLSVSKESNGVLAKGESASVTFVLTWDYSTDDDANSRDNADMAKAASLFEVSINAVSATKAAPR